eukprot:TRINITY_DN64151_c0_g2_i1.p1 TRINITY_DN64151_c0_g2~~TRINITY_DN64151_c0_g2_i1.p1  ORF type:complete len:251 (+),score=13.98 TRINITY_DN64151_c0_g2_i1:58-810(+)
MRQCWCKILNTPTNPTRTQIDAAYRKLALKFHPDVNPTAEQTFKDITAAKEKLIEGKCCQNVSTQTHTQSGFPSSSSAQQQHRQRTHGFQSQQQPRWARRRTGEFDGLEWEVFQEECERAWMQHTFQLQQEWEELNRQRGASPLTWPQWQSAQEQLFQQFVQQFHNALLVRRRTGISLEAVQAKHRLKWDQQMADRKTNWLVLRRSKFPSLLVLVLLAPVIFILASSVIRLVAMFPPAAVGIAFLVYALL